MEDLVRFVDFSNKDIFWKILDNDFPETCYLWGSTSHKPSGVIGQCMDWCYDLKEKNYPLIDGYKLWLNFFCDFVGYDVSIYYPKSKIIGDVIKVIFKGAFIDGYINWVHGQEGLFKDIIQPLLVLEKMHSESPSCKTCKFNLYKDENNKNFCPICNPPF